MQWVLLQVAWLFVFVEVVMLLTLAVRRWSSEAITLSHFAYLTRASVVCLCYVLVDCCHMLYHSESNGLALRSSWLYLIWMLAEHKSFDVVGSSSLGTPTIHLEKFLIEHCVTMSSHLSCSSLAHLSLSLSLSLSLFLSFCNMWSSVDISQCTCILSLLSINVLHYNNYSCMESGVIPSKKQTPYLI